MIAYVCAMHYFLFYINRLYIIENCLVYIIIIISLKINEVYNIIIIIHQNANACIVFFICLMGTVEVN